MTTTSSRIWVTFRRKGIHQYSTAPEDVSYLQSPHRHLFHFKVTISVTHDDREIEFHQFLNWLEALYDFGTLQLDNKSCEMIARDLIASITAKYPGRVGEVEVAEDGECGAVVAWDDRDVDD